MQSRLVKAHRLIALGLVTFLITHLSIHLTAIAGPETHIALLTRFQIVYRNWLVEPLLIIAILVQIFIGGKLIWRRWKQPNKGFWGWTQILSGGYIAIFLIMHSSAALTTRYIVGLDTNFYWAASTLNIDPLQFFFAPYYFFGIVSIFAHLGAAMHFGWKGKGGIASWCVLGAGVIIAVLIVSTFGGVFYDIQLPTGYLEYFESYT
ncbi:MAG: hypothetical protein ABJG15_09810 [Hyphomonadaceae bacterium]